MRLTFLWHWGVVVGDLLILPVFNGLVVPYFNFTTSELFLYLVSALVITSVAHWAWWPTSEKALNFMCPDWGRSGKDGRYRYRDMSVAGWIHFIFMTIQLILIMKYVSTPMSADVVLVIGVIFLVFVPFGVIEPGVIEGWPLSRNKKFVTFGIALVLWAIVGVVTWLKL